MKALRYLAVLFLLSFILILQGCGDDTAGALSMTALTSTNETNGIYSVSTKITYAPPSGKSAQGVVVTVNVDDLSGHVSTSYHTLSSDSNSFDFSVYVDQYSDSVNPVAIRASIGSMTSSDSIIIPVYTPPALAVATPDVEFGIGTVAGAYEDVAYTGGTAPIAVTSSNIAITASIINPTIAGGTVRVTLADDTATGTATVHLTDGAGADVLINVTYTD